MAKLRIISISLALLSTAVAIIGFSLLLASDKIIQNKINAATPLTKGSESFKRWEKVDTPIFFKVYLFNILNADEIKKGSNKVQVEEVGPYVYRERKEKTVLSVGEEITFEPITWYEFDQELSGNLTLNDKVTFLNLPLMGVVQMALKANDPAFNMIIPSAVKQFKEEPFPTKTAGELIDGYYVELLAQLEFVAGKFNKTFPSTLYNNTFGILAGKSGRAETGNWTIDSGESDVSQFTKMRKYQGLTELPYWNGTTCNMLNGTDGVQFPPNVHRGKRQYVFSPDLCRSVPFAFVEDSAVMDIDTLKYVMPKDFFDNIEENPGNECFCTAQGKDRDECLLEGILDVSTCRGAPVMMSLPHFYKASKSVYENFTGIRPDQAKHETYMNIEPRTGLVLEAKKRLQLSVKLLSHDLIDSVSKLPRGVIVPLAWVEEGATLDDKSKDKFDAMVTKKVSLLKIICIVLVAAGLLGCASSAAFYVFKRKYSVPLMSK